MYAKVDNPLTANNGYGWQVEDLDTDEMILNMGPQHPSTHGVLRLELRTDGEVIRGVRPHIGYLHRCFEKHAENVDYPGVIPYTDRMDYLASMGNSLGYALAVERLLGLTVSPYVNTIRVIMAELQRIASHCVAIGTYGMDMGAFTPFLHLLRDREKILDLFEWTCGARLLYNYNWVGGVSHDLPDGFVKACRDFLREYDATSLPELMNLLVGNKIFIKRTAEIGVLPLALGVAYDLTGPNLRGSGSRYDLRKDEPYCGYEQYDFAVCVADGRFGPLGSCFDRNWVRALEMRESSKILHQALDALEKMERTPVQAACPKRIKPNKGEIYLRTEAPRGQLGYYIVADGAGVNPYRVKVKSPCFTAMSVFHILAKGMLIADVVALIGSLDIVLGELDR
ncbi:MAG: NADH-quinone oxidoreductase subunit D [Vicinamibacteria bacterium]|nr:NADH-quinone oxidoreductase subunit D [Vicinamibacteria bacterium]